MKGTQVETISITERSTSRRADDTRYRMDHNIRSAVLFRRTASCRRGDATDGPVAGAENISGKRACTGGRIDTGGIATIGEIDHMIAN